MKKTRRTSVKRGKKPSPSKRGTGAPHRMATSHFGPTTPGGFFFLLMFLIMGAAVASGHNLLYLVVCLFLGAFVVMGNVAVMNLRGLKVEREIPDYVHAQTPHSVNIYVTNPRRVMDSFALEIREVNHSNGKQGGKAFIHLVEKQKEAKSSYVLDIPHRGWYEFHGLEVVTRFPFGFWERSRVVSLPERILAFPKVYRTWPEGMSEMTLEGEFLGNRSGMGDELLNFRDYEPGDPTRWIHWKNSAKVDRLTVSVFHHPKNRNVVVCLRTTYQDRRDGRVSNHFEEAVSWAATAVCKLLEKGVSVGYMDETVWITPQAGEGQRLRVLSHLALVPLAWSREMGGPFFDSLSAQHHETMFIEATETGVRIETGSRQHHFEETRGG